MDAGGDARSNESPERPNRATSPDVSTEMSALAAEPSPMPAGTRHDVRLDRRDATDFDELFAAHYARLVRALTIVADDEETAADAVQEAFVRAHVRWKRIRRYDDPIGWVRRVAINQLRDEHRRRGRKGRALARLASRDETVTPPSEIDEFDRLLAELPKQQRAATALFYVDGLSVAEIATALGVAEGSVKSNLFDARRRLKPVLEREARTEDAEVRNDD